MPKSVNNIKKIIFMFILNVGYRRIQYGDDSILSSDFAAIDLIARRKGKRLLELIKNGKMMH